MNWLRNKCFFIIYLVLLSVIIFNTNVKAKGTDDQFKKTFISNYHYVDSNGKFGDFEYFTRSSDGQIAYCIEPGVSLSNDIYHGISDVSVNEMARFVHLSPEQLQGISLAAYFGWGYNGQYGYDWIVATQSLIWEYLGRNIQFTSQNSKVNPWQYVIETPTEIQEKINLLKQQVNNYLTLPNFSSNFVKIPLHKSYSFISSNSLDGYFVSHCENCTAQIYANQLVVTPISKESGSVVLKKNNATFWETSFVVYAHDIGQNMLVPGNVFPLESNVNYEVVSGRLKLKKYDQDSKTCQAKKGGSLKGSIYKLYKENGDFIQELVIDENCQATSSDLELGKYYIKEYKAGENYELDLNSYFFELKIDTPTEDLIVYDKMYLGQIALKKIDSKTNMCESSSPYAKLEGAIYGIYSLDDKLLSTLIIDENCQATSERNLLLGDYYLKEITSPTGYKLDKNKYFFSVTKENADYVIYIDVKDDIYETKLIINKYYLTFNDSNPEEGAIFGVYLKKTNQKITSLVTDKFGVASFELSYGEYIIKQEKGREGYHFVDDLYFVVDENSEELSFLSLINKPFLGELEFLKIDSVTKAGLSGALIEIYNLDDVLIYRGVTDNEGKIYVSNLIYGTYYILEKKAPKGYTKFQEKLYFDILEDDQIVTIPMENKKEIKVPDTGINEFHISYFSVIFLLVGIKLIKYAKRQN